jgi:hypothetical protein
MKLADSGSTINIGGNAKARGMSTAAGIQKIYTTSDIARHLPTIEKNEVAN